MLHHGVHTSTTLEQQKKMGKWIKKYPPLLRCDASWGAHLHRHSQTAMSARSGPLSSFPLQAGSGRPGSVGWWPASPAAASTPAACMVQGFAKGWMIIYYTIKQLAEGQQHLLPHRLKLPATGCSKERRGMDAVGADGARARPHSWDANSVLSSFIISLDRGRWVMVTGQAKVSSCYFFSHLTSTHSIIFKQDPILSTALNG